MTPDVSTLISKAEALERSGDAEGAMSVANELVLQHPDEMKVWSLRGYLHALNRDYQKAVADMTRAIEINPMETYSFYSRGRYRFALGDNQPAIDDFTRGLDLCDRYHNDDFREELHFWRAEALLRLGRKSEALSDLGRVHSDDYTSWTYKLRTKADLLADCSKLPE